MFVIKNEAAFDTSSSVKANRMHPTQYDIGYLTILKVNVYFVLKVSMSLVLMRSFRCFSSINYRNIA